jgi:hypothetical protein
MRPIGWSYARAHPVRWLRWLRTGMLMMIPVVWVLCLLVTYQAHREISVATGRGIMAVTELGAARLELTQAGQAVSSSFRVGDVALVGPGAAYEGDITAASQELVLAAENNVAGIQGANTIQFADGLLVTYNDLVQQASTDFADSGTDTLALAGLGYASSLQAGVLNTIVGLRQAEQADVAADLGSRWLGPGDLWWLLLAPFFVMLILAAGTSYVLLHGFRRILSLPLTAALLLMLGLVVLVASLNVHDGGQAKAFVDERSHGLQAANPVLASAADVGFAASPWTLATGLVLVAGAAILTYAAYWPRLDEYRNRS